MRLRFFEKATLIAIAAGCLASAAPAQISLPGLDIRITSGRPPALRHERRSHRPGPDYVWIAGFWNDEGGHWAWVPGRWDRPAVRNVYWIAPRYIRSEGGYIYEPGHWSNQTLVVRDDVRSHRAWRRHNRDHDREIEREHRRYDRDRDQDRDH